MLRDQAELEAERRNHEDPDRARFEFYAFDESAGMAEDAWDVARRLRYGPPPATAAAQAAAAASEPPAHDPEPPIQIQGPTMAEVDPFAPPDPFGEPGLAAQEWAAEAPPRERRPRERPR